MIALATDPIDTTWLYALSSGCVIGVMMPTFSIFQCQTLVQRLRLFSRSLMFALPCLVAVAIAFVIQVRVADPLRRDSPVLVEEAIRGRSGDPSRALARGEQVDAAWFSSVSEAQEATSFLLMTIVAMVALLTVQLLGVLASLRRFVVTQEIDLVARDQAALHRANSAQESEGIPVSGIGAPR